MTVKELMEKLAELDPEATIVSRRELGFLGSVITNQNIALISQKMRYRQRLGKNCYIPSSHGETVVLLNLY